MLDDIHYEAARHANANGLQITYDSFGDHANPTVLLIMGLGTQMIHWSDDFCKLIASQNLRVIRFDNRDIGRTTWLTDYPVPSLWDFLGNSLFRKKINAPYLLDDMADDTLGLMDALNIPQAHLVGASMGGMIAQCTAIKAPSRVKSLTSIMSTTGDRSLPKAKAKISAKLLKPAPKELDAYVQHNLKVWELLHGPHFTFDANRIEQIIRYSRERGFNPAGVARQLAAIIDSPDRTPNLQQLDMPSLIIHGDEDPLVPVECGIATAEAIPNSKLQILKGMGHTLPTQLWQEIVEDIVLMTRA